MTVSPGGRSYHLRFFGMHASHITISKSYHRLVIHAIVLRPARILQGSLDRQQMKVSAGVSYITRLVDIDLLVNRARLVRS